MAIAHGAVGESGIPAVRPEIAVGSKQGRLAFNNYSAGGDTRAVRDGANRLLCHAVTDDTMLKKYLPNVGVEQKNGQLKKSTGTWQILSAIRCMEKSS